MSNETPAHGLDAIPEFYCPIPPASHPDPVPFDRASIEWLDGFGLFEHPDQRARLARSQPGLLAVLAVPKGTVAGLRLLSDYLMWLCAFDDEYCEEGPLAYRPGDLVGTLRRMLRVVESGTRSGYDDNYCASLLDIRLRLDDLASRAQVARWIGALRAYFLDQVWGAHLRVAGEIPSLNDYLVQRLYNGAMGTTIALIDIAGEYEVTPHELEDARVRALGEMTCALVGWDNDIMSYNKELLRVGDRQNLLDALVQDHSCGLSEAVRIALSLRDRVMCRFMALRGQVLATASRELAEYLTDLGSWIRANHEWGQRCARYVDVPAGEIRWATHPVDDRTTPPGIPSIGSWWTVA